MDHLTSLVLIAHIRLRLDIIEKYPRLLEGIDEMEIKRPMELAGLRSRLARAKATETAIAVTGKRYDAVLDQIDELHGVSKNNVGQLEQYAGELKSTIDGMIGGSNGGPNDGQDGQGSDVGQVITSKTEAETITSKDVGEVPAGVVAETAPGSSQDGAGAVAAVAPPAGQA